MPSAGQKFRQALKQESPLQVVGTINAYTAIMAESEGYKAIYLSGAGVANASFGLPDLGMTSLNDVLEDVRRITSASSLPLLVDIDTGWGGAFNISRSVKEMIKAGAAGVHIEIVSRQEMADRVKAAVDAKTDDDFVIMARTDALAVVGLEEVLERAAIFEAAGADAIFAEAMVDLDMYKKVVDAVNIPVLANITEFGATPGYTVEQLASVGISMALYPLSAFRAMNQAALNVYRTLRKEGTQESVISTMQTRAELYEFLGYHEYEDKLDELFAQDGQNI